MCSFIEDEFMEAMNAPIEIIEPIKMGEDLEMGEVDLDIDIELAERIQLGQFSPTYIEEIRNSKYAQFLNWANE